VSAVCALLWVIRYTNLRGCLFFPEEPEGGEEAGER
jgi:hypothetical protein